MGGWMEGWIGLEDGRVARRHGVMDGRLEGCMDGWMRRRTDGRQVQGCWLGGGGGGGRRASTEEPGKDAACPLECKNQSDL